MCGVWGGGGGGGQSLFSEMDYWNGLLESTTGMPFDLKFSHKNPIVVWDSVQLHYYLAELIHFASILAFHYLAATCIGLVIGVASCYAWGGGGGGGGSGLEITPTIPR